MRARFILALLLPFGVTGVSAGLEPLGEEEMSSVSGTGIAIGFDDLRILASPTSFLEAVGSEPAAATGFQRGDARYYGLSLSGDQPLAAWAGPCGSGFSGMGCPIGGRIPYFAPFDNPFVLRAFDYEGSSNVGLNVSGSVLELLAPTNSSPWRMSTWGELVIGGDVQAGDADNLHQGQMMLTSSRLSTEQPQWTQDRGNNKIRIFQHTDPDDPTIAFIWENHFSGNFRYSVNQQFGSADQFEVPPLFNDREGFYAMNIEAFVPMGQLFYQAILLGGTEEEDGNFSITLTRIPQIESVYSDFYSLAVEDSLFAGYERSGRPQRYYETHGFFRVGTGSGDNVTAGTVPEQAADTEDGIFFHKGGSSSTFDAFAWRPDINPDDWPGPPETHGLEDLEHVNIGNINIEGLSIQHLGITTCGVGGGDAC